MTGDDKPQFAMIITALAETLDRQLSEAVIALYFEALRDLSIDDVERGAAQCIRTMKFMPKPVEIREAAGRGESSGQERAVLAWSEAWDAVSRFGSYRSVTFADVVTGEVIRRLGGWPRFCRPDQDEQWARKEFLELYGALAAQRPGLPIAELPGLCADNNTGEMARFTPRAIVGRIEAKALPERTRTEAEVLAELVSFPGDRRRARKP